MGNTKRQGELAEMGFLYQATEEGFTVGRPFGGDVRYDRCWTAERSSTEVHRCR
jgi:hypothetical protein